MNNRLRTNIIAIILTLALTVGYAKAQTSSQKKAATNPAPATQAKPVEAAGSASSVTGSGTAGQLPKWVGSNSTSYVLGDSVITEDKTGKVGIGTTAPSSKLTVQGMIETTLGGVKFPDGTVQTSAAVGLSSIFHNATLTGNGTSNSALGVAVPLTLTGEPPIQQGSPEDPPVVNAINTHLFTGVGVRGEGRIGVRGRGQDRTDFNGGIGVVATGGNSTISFGGFGLLASGGDTDDFTAGDGVMTAGGNARGMGSGAGDGIFAQAGSGINGGSNGRAGFFFGNVEITGTLAKGGGSFKIDHPLDPENKYLYHSFVESPDMKNIYDGNIATDANGEAVVTMPDWFDALNRDFRYQLTVIGQFAQAIVADELKGNRFVIRTNLPNVKVSWQVTGIRKDAFANKHRIPVEENKAEKERGSYLHPEAFNQPTEKQIEWARNPERMKQLKEMREKHQ